MGYSKEIHDAVKLKLSTMQSKAKEEAIERRTHFFKLYPRAKEIENELSQTSIKIAKAILNRKDTVANLEHLRDCNLKLTSELNDIFRSAGVDEHYLEIRYSCEKCHDTGNVDGKVCSCMMELLKKEAYKRINMFSGLTLHSFDEFDLSYYDKDPIIEGQPSPQKRMKDIFLFCEDYAENFSTDNTGLFMRGGTGLGKTHLSLAVAKRITEKGYGVIYTSVPTMISVIEKEHFSNNVEHKNDTLSHVIHSDLLILDDLGTEFFTKFSVSVMYNIINSRDLFLLPTIISTNLSLKDIESIYSQRFVSRIIDKYVKLEFLGKDIRQLKRMEENKK